jgi:hypothetical protein
MIFVLENKLLKNKTKKNHFADGPTWQVNWLPLVAVAATTFSTAKSIDLYTWVSMYI